MIASVTTELRRDYPERGELPMPIEALGLLWCVVMPWIPIIAFVSWVLS